MATATAPAVATGGHEEHRTATGMSNNKLAMWIFLGSECLLFGGLISTYMLYRGRHSENLGPDQVWDIPFTSASSFVLLTSSLTMAAMRSSVWRGGASAALAAARVMAASNSPVAQRHMVRYNIFNILSGFLNLEGVEAQCPGETPGAGYSS